MAETEGPLRRFRVASGLLVGHALDQVVTEADLAGARIDALLAAGHLEELDPAELAPAPAAMAAQPAAPPTTTPETGGATIPSDDDAR